LQESERKDRTICIFFIKILFFLAFISFSELTMSELLLSLGYKTATEVLSIYKVLVLLRFFSLTMEWCSFNKAPGVQKKASYVIWINIGSCRHNAKTTSSTPITILKARSRPENPTWGSWPWEG